MVRNKSNWRGKGYEYNRIYYHWRHNYWKTSFNTRITLCVFQDDAMSFYNMIIYNYVTQNSRKFKILDSECKLYWSTHNYMKFKM